MIRYNHSHNTGRARSSTLPGSTSNYRMSRKQEAPRHTLRPKNRHKAAQKHQCSTVKRAPKITPSNHKMEQGANGNTMPNSRHPNSPRKSLRDNKSNKTNQVKIYHKGNRHHARANISNRRSYLSLSCKKRAK
jgi:hypothetical protein